MVRRRWEPRLGEDSLWSRFRKRVAHNTRWVRKNNPIEVLDAGCLDLEGLVLGFAILLLLVVAFLFVVPILIALVDVLVLVIIGALGTLGRVVFRRPWMVEARASDGTVHRWHAVGWRAGRQLRREVADSLAAGVVPPGQARGLAAGRLTSRK